MTHEGWTRSTDHVALLEQQSNLAADLEFKQAVLAHLDRIEKKFDRLGAQFRNSQATLATDTIATVPNHAGVPPPNELPRPPTVAAFDALTEAETRALLTHYVGNVNEMTGGVVRSQLSRELGLPSIQVRRNI